MKNEILEALDDLEIEPLAAGDDPALLTRLEGRSRASFFGRDGEILPGDIAEQADAAYALAKIEPNRVYTFLTLDGETVIVSTTYTGLNINTNFLSSTPYVWETMVIAEDNSILLWRYATETAARAGHNKVVDKLLALDAEPREPGETP